MTTTTATTVTTTAPVRPAPPAAPAEDLPCRHDRFAVLVSAARDLVTGETLIAGARSLDLLLDLWNEAPSASMRVELADALTMTARRGALAGDEMTEILDHLVLVALVESAFDRLCLTRPAR